MSPKRVFISYRRSDSSGHAGRLYDYLKNYFGDGRIFFDVDTIQPGVNFEEKINNELDNSEAVLVLIGNQWLDSRDKEGKRRLDSLHDYVRFEVEAAIAKNITIIPILLQDAQMPPSNTLPESLYDLSRRNAIRLNDDHWNSDLKLLAGVIKNALNVSRSLKERKIRSYRLIVFALSAFATLLAVLTQTTFDFWYVLVVLLLALVVTVNVALVTYLLGNIKKELDRLSWLIIGVAVIGAFVVTVGVTLGDFWIIWAAAMMVLEAGLLNFVEADE